MKIRMSVLCLLMAASAAVASDNLAPALTDTPIVELAPDRGVIPQISQHTTLSPSLYELDKQPIEQISPLIQRQYLTGAQSTFVKWTVKAGAVFPLHHHAYEQTTWIVSGRCDVFSQGKKYTMTAGMVMVFPPNVPHEFECSEDTVDIDFFAPQRQDWLSGVPSVATKK